MTAINRPIDVLLNNETAKANPSRREQSPLTDLNKKENSFGELLSAKQREAAVRDNKAADAGRREHTAQTKSQQAAAGTEVQSAQAETESGGTEVADDGKELPPEQLPPEQLEVAAQQAKELAISGETVSLESASIAADQLVEGKIAGEGKTDLVAAADKPLPVAGELNAAAPAADEAAESLEISPLLVSAKADSSRLLVAKEPPDEDSLLAEPESKGESRGETGILTQTLPIADTQLLSESQLAIESDGSLTSTAPASASIINVNIDLEVAQQTAEAQEVLPDAGLSAAAQAAAAATVPASLAAADQLKQTASIAQTLEDSLRSTPSPHLGETKPAKKGDFNLSQEVKIEVSAQQQTRQLPFGFELKRWLSEARTVLDPVAANITGAQDSDALTSANVLTPARLNSLTQAVQGLTTAPREAVSVPIQPPVNSAAWSQVVAQRIVWLAGNGIRAAELQLNPSELGPVDVKISVSNEQTSVHFTSQHAAVRDALELSVQRLRDMLESNGLGLADVDVSDQPGSRERETSAERSPAAFAGEQSQEQSIDGPLVRIAETHSLVDYYV